MKKTAALLAMLAAHSANALVIESSAGLVMEPTNINQTLMLDRFDASLGTLRGVDITLSGQGRSSVAVTSGGQVEDFFDFTSTLNLLFSSSTFTENVVIGLYDVQDRPINAGQTVNLDDVEQTVRLVLDMANADLSVFVGPGVFDVACASNVVSSLTGGGGNVSFVQRTEAGCGATVAYTFDASAVQPPPPTAVSAPGSMALAGLGLFGMAALRRRR